MLIFQSVIDQSLPSSSNTRKPIDKSRSQKNMKYVGLGANGSFVYYVVCISNRHVHNRRLSTRLIARFVARWIARFLESSYMNQGSGWSFKASAKTTAHKAGGLPQLANHNRKITYRLAPNPLCSTSYGRNKNNDLKCRSI